MRYLRLKIRIKRPALAAGREAEDRRQATSIPAATPPPRPPVRVSPAISRRLAEPKIVEDRPPSWAAGHAPSAQAATAPPEAPAVLPAVEPESPSRRPVVAIQPVLPSLERPGAAPALPSRPSPGETADAVPTPPFPPPPAERAPARSESVPVSPRGSREAAGPACPNCSAPLGDKPRVKSSCPHCGRTVHVRGWQRLFPWGLVPESEVDAVDFLEGLDALGITQDRCLERLGAPGTRPPEPGALGRALWTLCEERLPRLAPSEQVRLLNEMARYRHWRNEDARPLLRRAQVVRLQQMRSAGVKRVRLACRGAETCAVCREQAGRTLPLEQALQEQPLPHADCRHAGGLCRCHYAGAD